MEKKRLKLYSNQTKINFSIADPSDSFLSGHKKHPQNGRDDT
jgi:hypothetical protein